MAIGILLSGGTGERAGFDLPKQYMMAGDKMVISYCIETLEASEDIEAYIIVSDPSWQDELKKVIGDSNKFEGFANPGNNRQLSIYNGLKTLEDIADEDTIVMIHDAARPMLTVADIKTYVEACCGHDGVLPVLPMKDTLYYSESGLEVSGLLDRSKIYAGQAPEFFSFDKYLDANESIFMDLYKINGSTEPAIMAGMDICMVPGNEMNFKITTKADFERFVDIVSKRG